MKANSFRVFVLTAFVSSLAFQNISAKSSPANFFQQTTSIASSFSHPLGYQNHIIYVPRQTYDIDGALIENTDYGVKNPDLDNSNTCFHFDWRELFHAGEDLYYPDREVDTVGHNVTAVADGTVLEVTPSGWPGQGIVIEHTLPSGQKVYSVYLHVIDVQVSVGPVSQGQLLGTVIHQDYTGLFPDYHKNSSGNIIADSHLHFEIRHFPDARVIYTQYPDCYRDDGVGRGYTPPDIHPDNFPSPGAGYTDPTDFINSRSTPPTPTIQPTSAYTPTLTPICSPTPGADSYADCVIDFKANGSNNQWKDPNMVLGAPTCGNWNFLALGGGDGYVIVDMGAGEEIINGPGVDLKVYEVGSGCRGINESYTVLVSDSPSGPWTSLGSGSGISMFDLEGHELDSARYVKITDNNPNINNSGQTPGADIDAIEALNSNAFLTATPAPTFTPQPTATPTRRSCYYEQGSSVNLKVASLSKGISFAIGNLDRIAEQAALLYRVRDEVLNATGEGRRYIDLYYAHSAEIAWIMDTHFDLAEQGLDVIDALTPNLQALLDGQGNAATITNAQIQQAQAFLDALLPYASPALQQAIADERAHRPLESMAGMNMDQAWAYLNGYQLQWLQPISNGNPYPSQVGRTIPIQFTLTDLQGNFVTDQSVTIELVDADGNVVVGPIGLGNNPATGIVIQNEKYHYNLQTKGLSAGLYTLRVYYNAVNPGQPYAWMINLVTGKK